MRSHVANAHVRLHAGGTSSSMTLALALEQCAQMDDSRLGGAQIWFRTPVALEPDGPQVMVLIARDIRRLIFRPQEE